MKQKRRKFIKTSAALGLGLPFLGCSNEMAEAVKKSKYLDTIGLQLWTVRNQLDIDFAGTIKKIAAQGYYQVEAMNVDQVNQLAPVAKDNGLELNSSFIQWSHLTGRWDLVEKSGGKKNHASFDAVIEDANKKNLKHLVFGYIFPEERGLENYKKLADALNQAGEKCNSAGIQLNYHNHNFEFDKSEGEMPYDILRKRCDPKLMQFELDVFWASIAGVDPVQLMKDMKGQIRLLHLKDKLKDTPNVYDTGDVPKNAYKELGNGVVDIKACIDLAEATGVEYCFVEQDESPDPIASTKTSIDWLRR